ncbi:MAG: DNA-binding protein [Chloroflexi bacterium]|nr:DNA-binding protein [Chloroflexota bacterium]
MNESWDARPSRVIYRRFAPDEALVAGLDAFARSEGIRSAVISSCIGSLSSLRLRNLCRDDDGEFGFERQTVDEILEIVSAEGYIQPLPEGGIRTHVHIAAARPSGELIGGHCEEATICTGAFLYLQVLEEDRGVDG